MKKPIAIVILAAGCSRRLGQNKQLISVEGQALITRQCCELLRLELPIYCVVGYQIDEMKLVLKKVPKINLIDNNQWSEGLGGSIALATDLLKDQFEQLLFVLGDQWQLSACKLNAFIQSHNLTQDRITIATNNQNLTNLSLSELSPPVIFPVNYYNELCLLQGESGAKVVLKTHKQKITPFYLPEAFVDLDTQEQLTKLRSIYPE
ncbi:nucleotidyltransferase family protein [Thalassotalea profundi]|uniref:MobA-like NTP transferase domain-containing protein n=1 Tax=Thalassotalea profundi TaxID=2036687 RepID=A0ABQ3IVE3_9GAMM|nr:nucleotidyltransferase family protein [Thalassotalea profundi]GHE92227.1 hypothetical protein GCM10011501_22200 [Thalassotalea profundi]